MERAANAARDHVLERCVERLLDTPSAQFAERAEAELEKALRFAASTVLSSATASLPAVQRADEFRPAMKVDHVRVPVARVDQAVFDHLPRHADEHQRVLLQQFRAARHVEHAGDLAAVVEDRRGGAGERRVARIEMFVLAHGDAVALGEARAHSVGARFALAPQRADAKAVGSHGFARTAPTDT